MKKMLALACVISAGAGSLAFANAGHGHKTSKWLERMDGSGDGKVTLAEMKSAANGLFDKADKNRDARVTQPEQAAFESEMRTEFKRHHAQAVAERFSKQDTNADGHLSRDEATKLSAERFDRIDENQDGKLTKAELTAQREARKQERGERGTGRVGKLLERIDDNHDGALDRNEVDSQVQRHFARLDRNGDGTLEASEMKRGHGKRGSHGRGGEHECAPKGDSAGAGGGAAE
jgi:Ca2+-binding EF-hand superfamily protein